MDWEIRIPTGEEFVGYESKEIGEYRHLADKEPIFDKSLDVFLQEKLGPEWLPILRAEHKALLYVKEFIPSCGACHNISFKGKENGSYVFEADSFYDCPSDPGSIIRTIKVAQVGSVIEEEDDTEQEQPTGFARIGKWMYENL